MFDSFLDPYWFLFFFYHKRLRDLNLQDKTEINHLRKQNEELTVKLKATTKENETLKTDAAFNQSQINELKDQVSWDI